MTKSLKYMKNEKCMNGEAQEWENLVQMRDKILNTVERGDFFERNES